MDAAHVTQLQTEHLCALSTWIDMHLFADEPLGPVLLTFSRPGANTKAAGFFKPHAWKFCHTGRRKIPVGETIGEIALCPEGMFGAGVVELVQTLVHEKCHQWQFEYGKPPRAGYHDRAWAEKMKDVGLTPSATGQPGGRQTGQAMRDYITPGGPLEQLCARLPLDLQLPLLGVDRAPLRSAGAGGYVRFACPSCTTVARARRSARLVCGDCQAFMVVS